MRFVTADNHFGHKAIIGYCKRPFSSVDDMDQEMIRRWNAVVSPDDIVYHLGDLCLGRHSQASRYLSQLNGHIYILANYFHHDRHWLPKSGLDPAFGPCPYYESKQGHWLEILPPIYILELKEYGEGKWPKALVLCHYPLSVWDRKHYGSWHVYGHSHGQFENVGLSFDVGVDSTDYTPVSIEEIARRILEKEAKGEK